MNLYNIPSESSGAFFHLKLTFFHSSFKFRLPNMGHVVAGAVLVWFICYGQTYTMGHTNTHTHNGIDPVATCLLCTEKT